MTEAMVRVSPTSAMRFQPLFLRQLTKVTGRSFQQMMDSEEAADKFQTFAFMEIKRHHPEMDAAEAWNLAATTEIEIGAEAVDPTANGQPTISPPSAVTGG